MSTRIGISGLAGLAAQIGKTAVAGMRVVKGEKGAIGIGGSVPAAKLGERKMEGKVAGVEETFGALVAEAIAASPMEVRSVPLSVDGGKREKTETAMGGPEEESDCYRGSWNGDRGGRAVEVPVSGGKPEGAMPVIGRASDKVLPIAVLSAEIPPLAPAQTSKLPTVVLPEPPSQTAALLTPLLPVPILVARDVLVPVLSATTWTVAVPTRPAVAPARPTLFLMNIPSPNAGADRSAVKSSTANGENAVPMQENRTQVPGKSDEVFGTTTVSVALHVKGAEVHVATNPTSRVTMDQPKAVLRAKPIANSVGTADVGPGTKAEVSVIASLSIALPAAEFVPAPVGVPLPLPPAIGTKPLIPEVPDGGLPILKPKFALPMERPVVGEHLVRGLELPKPVGTLGAKSVAAAVPVMREPEVVAPVQPSLTTPIAGAPVPLEVPPLNPTPMLAAPIRQSVRETKPELGRRPPDATPLAIPQTPNCIEPTRAVAVAHLDGPPTLAGAEANVPVVKATDATSVLLELPVPRGKLTEAHRERPPEPVTRQEPQQSYAPIAPPVPMAVPPVTAPVKRIEVAKKELPGAVPVIAPTGMMPVEIPTVVPPRNNQPAVPNPMPTFGELGTITESQPVAVQVPMQPVVDVRLREKPVKLQSEMPSPAVPVKVNPAITVPVAAIPRAVEHDREPTMELPVQMSEPAIQVKSIPSDPLPAHAPEARMEQPSSAPALSHAVTPLPEKPEHLQQMRTFSLEFSPEGAAGDPSRDVRLHVTQRSGDVHISVDSNDTSLSNKLRDGVQDLVGHMTQAGYEADAWSQSGGERRRAPEPEPETKPVINKDATDGIAFEQLFQGKEIL